MNMNFDNNYIYNYLKADEISNKIAEISSDNCELYIVGGYLRDLIIKKDTYDRDYMVKGCSAIEFGQKVADAIGGYFIVLDETFDISRVVMPDKRNTLDFAGCWKNDLNEDLGRRDFTINALACRINTPDIKIIDLFNGQEDLKNKTIRAISETNLTDDPLRLLRAFRFSSQLGYNIDTETFRLIEKHKTLITSVATERINAELLKMFEGDFTSDNLVKMKDIEFLDVIFPGLTAQRNVPPNLHHHLGLIDHSIESVKQMELITKKSEDWVKEKLYSEFTTGIKNVSLMKIAGLLHDFGKPDTWQIDEEGRHRFIRHEEIGAELVEPTLRQLKFSKNMIKYITKLIKYHLYPSQLIKEKDVSEKAVMRFFRRIEDETPELIILAMSDRLSARGPEISDEIVNENLSGLEMLLEKYRELKDKIEIPRLLTGQDVMQTLNIPASPKVGQILNAVKEAQINSKIFTKEEALEYIKSLV